MRNTIKKNYSAARIVGAISIVCALAVIAGSYFYGSGMGVNPVTSLVAGAMGGSLLFCCCCCFGMGVSSCFGHSSEVSPYAESIELGHASAIPTVSASAGLNCSTNAIGTPCSIPNQPISLRSGIYQNRLFIREIGDDDGPKPGLYAIDQFGVGNARVDFNHLTSSAGREIKAAVESGDSERMWRTLREHRGEGVQIESNAL